MTIFFGLGIMMEIRVKSWDYVDVLLWSRFFVGNGFLGIR